MLIHGKVNDLFNIDAKITDTYKNINDCSKQENKWHAIWKYRVFL